MPGEHFAAESEWLLEMRKAGQYAKKATTLESRMNALTLHAVYTSPGHSCFCPAIDCAKCFEHRSPDVSLITRLSRDWCMRLIICDLLFECARS
ncbi:MAG: hypothetical protein ACK56F_05620 [bacterium]